MTIEEASRERVEARPRRKLLRMSRLVVTPDLSRSVLEWAVQNAEHNLARKERQLNRARRALALRVLELEAYDASGKVPKNSSFARYLRQAAFFAACQGECPETDRS